MNVTSYTDTGKASALASMNSARDRLVPVLLPLIVILKLVGAQHKLRKHTQTVFLTPQRVLG